MRKFSLTAAVVTGLAVVLSGPASAQDTSAQFVVASTGALSISPPTNISSDPVTLATVDYGTIGSSGGNLGTVTVNDTREGLLGLVNDWEATVSWTDFANSDDPTKKILASAVVYASGSGTVVSGTGTFTAGVGLASGGVAGAFAGSGPNQVTWNPTLTATLVGTEQAGSYVGTVTHSVTAVS